MIELIFVIVILGILAAVAIPKLTATRDDAKVATEVTSAANALQNLAAGFTAVGSFVNYTVTDANDAVNCFTFTLNNASDGNVSLAVIGGVTATCPAGALITVKSRAINNNLITTSGAAKTYLFGGTGVVH